MFEPKPNRRRIVFSQFLPQILNWRQDHFFCLCLAVTARPRLNFKALLLQEWKLGKKLTFHTDWFRMWWPKLIFISLFYSYQLVLLETSPVLSFFRELHQHLKRLSHKVVRTVSGANFRTKFPTVAFGLCINWSTQTLYMCVQIDGGTNFESKI